MSEQLDFTETNENGYAEGFYVKKYRDGEVLIKVFFEGWSGRFDCPEQDEAEAWLSVEQVQQLAEILEETGV